MDIDFVVLWVDGNDPEWRAEKAKYQGAVTDDSNSSIVFEIGGLCPIGSAPLRNLRRGCTKFILLPAGMFPNS